MLKERADMFGFLRRKKEVDLDVVLGRDKYNYKPVARRFATLMDKGQTKTALRYLSYCLMGLPFEQRISRFDIDYIFKHMCESTGNKAIYHNHRRSNDMEEDF
ncbi:hypothetical protein SDC9_15025 [bioreactor metagenome]|uniref:Uncharacterized protein n=1 Tax=bioreactor metagenome TaxID=1076179 RepID=A0A644TQK7_9ZZZZ